MTQDTEKPLAEPAATEDFESKVAALGDNIDRGDVPDDKLSADLDAAVNSAPEVVKMAELLAAGGGKAAELRLRHLSELIGKGALDQDIYEAIVQGTVHLLDPEGEAADLVRDFRLRYKCDLTVFESPDEFVAAALGHMPAAAVVVARPGAADTFAALPELLVAAFGHNPVPVVLLSDDDACLLEFEALTYPTLTFVPTDGGPEDLLDALDAFIAVDRTGASLEPGEDFKDKIGLNKAQAIQHNLLPEQIPEVPGLQIAAYYDSCQEVGGDYYDFLPLSDGRLGVVCADVSGKGVGAAMVMVMFRSILRLAAQDAGTPQQVIARTNQLVSKDMLKGMFVSAAYLVVDPKTGGVELVNAGHMPVMHWPFDQVRPVNVPVKGMVLGLAGGEQFERATQQGRFELQPGELFCLYTDGVVEAENPDREQFGEERLAEAIRDAGRDASPQQTVDKVIAAVEAFADGAPQHDDTTLIILKAV